MKSDNDISCTAAAKKLNNSGFTLIELIVSIIVMLFVILSVAVFVSVGTRGYSTSSAEVSLQMESQIALNQIEDIIMAGEGLAPPVEIEIDDGSTAVVYPVAMYNERLLLILDVKNKRLLEYSQSVKSEDMKDSLGAVKPVEAEAIESDVKKAVSEYRDYVIAQGATSLTLSQPDPKSALVNVTIGFERPGKSRSVSGSYCMRNFVPPEE